jgi:hypothetical protein
MKQSRKLIIKDSPTTNAEKVSAPILPQVFQIPSKSKKGVYHIIEGSDWAVGKKCRAKPAMTVKLERDTIAKLSIPILLFLGYLS